MKKVYLSKYVKKKDLFFLLHSFYFFRSYSPFSEKGDLKIKKVKDYFVLDSYLLNRWIGAYSGLES